MVLHVLHRKSLKMDPQPGAPCQRQPDVQQRQCQVEQRHGAVTPAGDDVTLVEVRAMCGRDGFAAVPAMQKDERGVKTRGAD